MSSAFVTRHVTDCNGDCHNCTFGVAAVQHGRWSDARTRASEQHIRLNMDAKLVITTQSLNFTHADLKIYKPLMLLYGIELA
jgi:hypothetical protein